MTTSFDSATMLLPEGTANPYELPPANNDNAKIRPKLTTGQSLRRSFSKRFGLFGSSPPVYGNKAPAKSQDSSPNVESRPEPRPVQLEDQPSQAQSIPLNNESSPARPSSRSSLRRTLSRRLGSSRPNSVHMGSLPQVRVELVDLPPVTPAATQPSPSPSALASRHRRSGSADGTSTLQPERKKNFRWSTGALPTLNSLPTVPEDGGKEVRFDLGDIAKRAEAGTGLHRSGTVPSSLGRSGSIRNLLRSKSAAGNYGHRPTRSLSTPTKVKPIVEEDDDDEDYDDYSHRQEFNYSMGMYDYSDYGRMDY